MSLASSTRLTDAREVMQRAPAEKGADCSTGAAAKSNINLDLIGFHSIWCYCFQLFSDFFKGKNALSNMKEQPDET
jgi:hypothetical protein